MIELFRRLFRYERSEYDASRLMFFVAICSVVAFVLSLFLGERPEWRSVGLAGVFVMLGLVGHLTARKKISQDADAEKEE